MSARPTLDFHTYQELVRVHGAPRMQWLALGAVEDECLGFAVHLATFQGRVVMVRNRQRLCWELPGGRREGGESITETARRELWEECGVRRARIQPHCLYQVEVAQRTSHGLLCLSQLDELPGPPAWSEIAEARALAEVPAAWCYPHIQGRILLEVSTCADHVPWDFHPPHGLPSLLSILTDAPAPTGCFPPPMAEPDA